MEIGGIDALEIVESLMAIEARPLASLTARKDDASAAVNAISAIRSNMDAFRLAAARLAQPGSFDRYSATVSDTDVAAATVGSAASPGTMLFRVSQLARAHGLRSIGTVASSSVSVTSESVLAVAAGTRTIGIETVRAGAGLTAGSSLSVAVTQASAAATIAGASAPAAQTTIDGTNNTIDMTVNGVARTITVADGTYSATGLAQAIQSAFDASGGGLTADIDGNGTIAFATTREGSEASLQITGGSALASVGHVVGTGAQVGTDGVVDVDGTTTTISRIEVGDTLALATGAGTLDVTLSGGLRVGSSNVSVVSTGDRSLASVAAAINDARAGVTAAAVRVADGEWLLQLNSTTTGVDGNIAIDDGALDGVGGLIESSAAQNARITIGDGAGAYDIEASGNTFADVLPGVTITARSVSTEPVTVEVGRDLDPVADDVEKLVSAANTLLADIKVQTRYDVESNASGVLAGNGTIRRLADQVRRVLGDVVDGVSGVLPSTAGITSTKEGNFAFDRAAFIDAASSDPALIERLFARGGTDSGDVLFVDASATTVPGSYDVDITTAATRATSGLLFDGGAAADARVAIRIGDVTATYDVTAGQDADDIVDGLNRAIADAGLAVVAVSDGTGLRVRADAWGAAGDFELNTDVLGAGSWTSLNGDDVVGTIDGVLATGVGRTLSLVDLADSPAAGLQLEIAEGITGSLGPVEYLPGIAARIEQFAATMTDDETGTLTTSKELEQARVADLNDQIERFEARLDLREETLLRQWANVQTVLAQLQSQGDWITSQLSSLSTNWGPRE